MGGRWDEGSSKRLGRDKKLERAPVRGAELGRESGGTGHDLDWDHLDGPYWFQGHPLVGGL